MNPDANFEYRAEYLEIQLANPDAGKRLDLRAVAEAVSLPAEQIQGLCQQGVIRTVPGEGSDQPSFDDDAIFWLRRLKLLQAAGAVNTTGLTAFLELLQEVERLRRELRARAER